MATFTRADDGTWSVTLDATDPQDDRNEIYDEAVLRYLDAIDPAYTKAEQTCESEFVKALIRVSSVQDAGWDPYETTLRAVPGMEKLHASMPEGDEHYETARHLALWSLQVSAARTTPPRDDAWTIVPRSAFSPESR